MNAIKNEIVVDKNIYVLRNAGIYRYISRFITATK